METEKPRSFVELA